MWGELYSYPELPERQILGPRIMTKLKLYYFGHNIRRQASLEQTIMLSKIESSRKSRKPNMRRTDSMEEAIGIILKEGHCRPHSFRESPGVRADSTAHNKHT